MGKIDIGQGQHGGNANKAVVIVGSLTEWDLELYKEVQ